MKKKMLVVLFVVMVSWLGNVVTVNAEEVPLDTWIKSSKMVPPKGSMSEFALDFIKLCSARKFEEAKKMMAKPYLSQLKRKKWNVDEILTGRFYTDLNFKKYKYKVRKWDGDSFNIGFKSRRKSNNKKITMNIVIKKENGKYII